MNHFVLRDNVVIVIVCSLARGGVKVVCKYYCFVLFFAFSSSH
jgi:hypothetical protein